MTKKNEILACLRSLKTTLAMRYHIKGIALFGSTARGKSLRKSDIDILADFDEKASLFHLSGAANFLEEQLGRKVDIVPRRALRKELRKRVFNEAIPV
jgi:uncharacterized protein